MKVSKMPKGKDKMFASGGRAKMFGAGDRTKSKFPASPQRPGQTSQHGGKAAPKRSGGKARSAVVDVAGDSGGSPGASQLSSGGLNGFPICERGSGRLHPKIYARAAYIDRRHGVPLDCETVRCSCSGTVSHPIGMKGACLMGYPHNYPISSWPQARKRLPVRGSHVPRRRGRGRGR
jgi:hypothetical protein